MILLIMEFSQRSFVVHIFIPILWEHILSFEQKKYVHHIYVTEEVTSTIPFQGLGLLLLVAKINIDLRMGVTFLLLEPHAKNYMFSIRRNPIRMFYAQCNMLVPNNINKIAKKVLFLIHKICFSKMLKTICKEI